MLSHFLSLALVIPFALGANRIEVADPDCVLGEALLAEGGAFPPIIIIDDLFGSSGGPGCDGCLAGMKGTVIWMEAGTGVIGLPNGATLSHDVKVWDSDDFGGNTMYRIPCGGSADWDFVSQTSGALVTVPCSACQ